MLEKTITDYFNYTELNMERLGDSKDFEIDVPMKSPEDIRFKCCRYSINKVVDARSIRKIKWIDPVTGQAVASHSYYPAKMIKRESNDQLYGSLCWIIEEDDAKFIKHKILSRADNIEGSYDRELRKFLSYQWLKAWYDGNLDNLDNGWRLYDGYQKKHKLMGSEYLNHYLFISDIFYV